MRNRIKKTLVAIAALAALAFGGSAIAQAGNGSGQPATTPAAESAENVPENSAKDTDTIQDENGKDDASEKGESGEAESEKGESAKDDDGPGGHADEPGNADAEHEFEGNE